MTFKQLFNHLTALTEDISVGGGALGSAAADNFGGAVGNNDFYAPNDARLPYAIGARRRKKRRKKRGRLKKRK
tara:strand:- start:339 stop:557 length:219 start_codon:yes stop_codon:yes gene_type:complete